MGVVYGPAEMTGGGIQMGVPTIVESTGGGEKGEQKESARTGQSVVGGGGLVGRQFHEHVFYSYFCLPQKRAAAQSTEASKVRISFILIL